MGEEKEREEKDDDDDKSKSLLHSCKLIVVDSSVIKHNSRLTHTALLSGLMTSSLIIFLLFLFL